MRINTNVGALAAARNLGNVENAVAKSSEKLSSGFRINKAGDDAAGLGIANIMRADIRAYTQAQRNAEQATSVYSIMDGAAQNIQKMLERMKELAAQSASDTVDDTARAKIQAEYTSLNSEISRVAKTTKFQGSVLTNGGFGSSVDTNSTILAGATGAYSIGLTGAAAGSYTLTSGAASNLVTMTASGGRTQSATITAATRSSVSFSSFGITINYNANIAQNSLVGNLTVAASSGQFLIGASGVYGGLDSLAVSAVNLDVTGATDLGDLDGAAGVDDRDTAILTLAKIDTAMTRLNDRLGTIGAGQNRLESAIESLKSTIQNYAAAESTVRDLDMAAEMVTFSKNQILVQAGTAMLAQANQSGQGVLKLLQ